MKNVVLFGAGQVGAMVSRLMGPGYWASCFADNDEKKWGSSLAGIPVCAPHEALAGSPDCICLCALDEERCGQMERQVRELGVFKGDFAILINAAFPDRSIHLFDTFEGFDAKDVAVEVREGLSRAKEGDFAGTAIDYVDQRLLYRERARYYQGYFPDTFACCSAEAYAFVSIDADLYAPTAAALPLFWERLSPGGVLMIHDVNSTQFRGPGKAVKEFCRERKLLPVPICDLHGSVLLRKG